MIIANTARTLRGKFLSMSLWADRYKISNFPISLKSLETNKPCPEQLKKDFQILYSFSSHPAYLPFFHGIYPSPSRKE